MMDYKSMALNIGLPLQFAVKEYRMFDVFSKLLARGWNFPLVGGTAINKVYLAGEERFSEDLDFEVYGKQKLKVPELEGYKIKGPYVYRRNIRFEAEYTELGKKDKIRIDVNIKPNAKVKIVQGTAIFLTGNTITNLNTFTLEGLVARKLLAMTRRTEGKDFYDVWHSKPKIENKILRKEIKLLARIEKIKKDWINELIDRMKEISHNDLSKFNNYIPVDRRPDWKLIKNDVLIFIENLGR